MRIYLQDSTGDHPLTGELGSADRAAVGVADFQVTAAVMTQALPLLRSASAGQADRGNLTTTVRFTVVRTFASHAAATLFAADHAVETPREGTLRLQTETRGCRYLQGAVLLPPSRRISGCGVSMDYTATGRAVGTLLPAVIISSSGGLIASQGGGGTMPEVVADARGDGLLFRTVEDSISKFMEVGFYSPTNLLTGNAATGWLDPGGHLRFRIANSMDLETWAHDLIDSPSTPEDGGDGDWIYWSRAVVPLYWRTIMVDLTATSARSGKSITGISVMLAAVSLPNFPYAMPAAAATLQTDLRAAGYTGATVTSTSAALVATAKNHTPSAAHLITLTQSGGSVTAAASQGSSISLPSFPYAMPSARASLQADLRTAGLTGAVVMLYGDPWTIVLPDRAATDVNREFSLTISPGDPYKGWDMFGNYLGEAPANGINGTSGNVRTPGGYPLLEAPAQFFRLGISAGPNNRF